MVQSPPRGSPPRLDWRKQVMLVAPATCEILGRMRTHRSWSALMNPGQAASYFGDWAHAPICPGADFHPLVGLWMAELARLAYRPHPAEATAPRGPAPAAFLQSVGLRETLFLDVKGTQCLGVEPRDAAAPFAILAFRGTSELRDFVVDVAYRPVGWDAGHVHFGFAQALSEVWPGVQPWLASREAPLFLTGHSLGAALATLAAVRAEVAPRAVYTFGSPRVGDLDFARAAEAKAPIFRVVNDRDVVATSPGFQPFAHAGQPIRIDIRGNLRTEDPRETAAGGPSPTRPRFGLVVRLVGAAAAHALSFQGPPPELADHAPANYVAGLEVAARSSAPTP